MLVKSGLFYSAMMIALRTQHACQIWSVLWCNDVRLVNTTCLSNLVCSMVQWWSVCEHDMPVKSCLLYGAQRCWTGKVYRNRIMRIDERTTPFTPSIGLVIKDMSLIRWHALIKSCPCSTFFLIGRIYRVIKKRVLLVFSELFWLPREERVIQWKAKTKYYLWASFQGFFLLSGSLKLAI